MQISLFDGVSATTDSGETVDVGPAKCQAVLAALALRPGSAVPVARLVEAVWGERPPRTAEKTLQSYVTRLRKSLGADSIVRTGAAYRLDVGPDSVDVARFERRFDAGDIEAALAEWTGTPLAGLEAPGLASTVDALVEQWLRAVEIELDRRVQVDAPTAVGPLTELTANHPFREGLWALLMTALYRVGRQADALGAYRTARQHLVEHLGVEPGPRLRELEASILGQDERLAVERSPTERPPSRPAGTATFGFCDVEDAAWLWVTHRQDAAAVLVRRDDLVRATVSRHGGYLFSTGGDSFGVAFPRATDAAAWATELQAAVATEPWPGGIEIRLRIGLHTGEAQEHGHGYFGPAVSIAAQIAAAAHGGQTLLSGVTAELLEGVDLRELGTYRLDGAVAERRLLQLGAGEHPPLRVEDSSRGNLPRRLGRLIGRETELHLVADALATSAVVTLVGPGGVGKTRLALAAARMVDDSVAAAWLVELAEIASSADVPRAVADTLGVKESPGRGLGESIVAVLQARRELLVLDNCEHVVEGAAQLAHAIAESCPSTRVLASSREGLGVGGEQLIEVSPLEPTGAGVELFNERAAAACQTFDPQAGRSDVEEICRRLEGLPLAIELAAARARSLSPADLVERLEDGLRLLTGGRRTGAERHRTLRATIQWSYDLLPALEQLLFQRLSIFTGPFDLTAAGAVGADAQLGLADVDDLVAGLVDRSMLIVEPGPFGRRFRLLETMRQFAAERLSESGEADRVAERHAEWCLARVHDIRCLLAGHGEIEGVARLRELWTNLRAAVAWACATGDAARAFELTRPLAAEISLRFQTEIADWLEQILAITPPGDGEVIVFASAFAAHRYMLSQDRDAYERLVGRYGEPDHPLLRHARAFVYEDDVELVEHSPRAARALREQGDDHLADFVEMGSAGSLLVLGRFEEIDAFAATLVVRFRANGPPTLLSWTLWMLGYSASCQGDHERADRYFEESAAVGVPTGTISLNAPIEARGALRRGNISRAVRILRAHVEELLEADVPALARLPCVVFIDMMAALDRLADAAPMLAYLGTTGQFGALSSRTLVAEAASKVAAATQVPSDHPQDDGEPFGDADALTYMRGVLDQLADDQQLTC